MAIRHVSAIAIVMFHVLHQGREPRRRAALTPRDVLQARAANNSRGSVDEYVASENITFLVHTWIRDELAQAIVESFVVVASAEIEDVVCDRLAENDFQ